MPQGHLLGVVMTADTESTSAALARVTAERDEQAARADDLRATLATRTGQLEATRRAVELLKAELASAHTELQHLRYDRAHKTT
jgi:hypothetical protein